MFHYIDHKDRQGTPRTACGLNAYHAWTPTFWDRVAFMAYQGNPRSGTGPADRCKHCERAATGTKHQAPAQPGLHFWAEATDGPAGRTVYAVISQVDGYPAGEAHDDYFVNYADADAIAKQYAQQYPNH